MGQIHILDSATANQIAAGEVVERPASAVKELIENAVDAKATHVRIHIQGGGLKRIVVEDNGHGMEPEDALLCFSRYATSKLQTADQLLSLLSFGFRGEALPSIASVSKVCLTTRHQSQPSGTEVFLQGGNVQTVRESKASVGTRFEITDLFFNTPARLKFMRSEKLEAESVEQVVKQAILSLPHVGFSLDIDGKPVLDVQAAFPQDPPEHPRRLERAIQCLGQPVRPHLYPFLGQTDLLAVDGYVVSPLHTRRDSKGIFLFVNNRPIWDRQLLQAVKVAYRSLLEVGRFPIGALHLQMDQQRVDVNVHPQKLEVRFADFHRVQSHVIRLIGDFLATTPWLLKESQVYTLPHGSYLGEESVEIASFAPMPSLESATRRLPFDFPIREDKEQTSVFNKEELSNRVRYCDLSVVGQVDQTYLVLQSHEAMIILDQHAAHERVLFERCKQQMENHCIEAQALLFPYQILVSAVQMEAFLAHSEGFKPYGLDVEVLSQTHLVMRGLPLGMPPEEARMVITDTLEEWAHNKRADGLLDLRDRICALIACHSSVRAGQRLSHQEIAALLEQLDVVDLKAHCPHGRPVARTIPFLEVAKWFHRL